MAARDQVVSVPTCTGEERETAFSSPSCPRSFFPHDQSVPSVFTASACWLSPPPRATEAQVERVPTWVGDERDILSPKPPWPLSLFPQTHSVPSDFTPNVRCCDATMVDQVMNAPTCTGEERWMVSPKPRLPELYPHPQIVLSDFDETVW